ncbi:hypothetical protein Vadar_023139 [Vaccinium darrowii]|uniref:Uncharacterized protein n=1 Tax=Vaccinium darrowii TaxID=229202 RepID=A0ACB7Z604_9ERIC|nr:hypothetical protein Vadar_023139 [Vaccinium darrowii]
MTFDQWWISLSRGNASDDRALAVFICWFIWKNRNQWQFEGQQWEPRIVFEKAKVVWKEYSAACELTKPKGRISSTSLPSVWLPPPPDCLKINVDGALDSQNGFGSVGLIARTSSGAIVEARVGNFIISV